jgi:hypothetical protein
VTSACGVELFICLSDYQVGKQGVHVGCMSEELHVVLNCLCMCGYGNKLALALVSMNV